MSNAHDESPGGGQPRTWNDDVSAQGNQLLAIVWSLTVVSFLFLTLRIYAKVGVGRVKGMRLWWDDYILVLSWVLLLLGVAITTAMVRMGFGKHIWEVNPANIPMFIPLEKPNGVLGVLSALWSKTSFAVSLLRLTKGWLRWTVWAIIGTMNLLMLTAAVMVALGHRPPVPASYLVFNIFSAAWSGVMDIVLALLPWAVIMKLPMKPQEKFGVAIAMSMGVCAGATAFVKCVTLQSLGNGDFTYYGCGLVIWGVVEPATTIMAASIPTFRSLFKRPASMSYQTGSTGQRQSQGVIKRVSGNSSVLTADARTSYRARDSLNKSDVKGDVVDNDAIPLEEYRGNGDNGDVAVEQVEETLTTMDEVDPISRPDSVMAMDPLEPPELENDGPTYHSPV